MTNLEDDYDNILNLANTTHPMIEAYLQNGNFTVFSKDQLLTDYITIHTKIVIGDVNYYRISSLYLGCGCYVLLYCSTSLNYIIRVTDGSVENTIKGPYIS